MVNCVAPGLLEGIRATANLEKPADKNDCADMVVAVCRTDTMTGQTMVIDSGRYFHRAGWEPTPARSRPNRRIRTTSDLCAR
jgi:hypothetical protein